LLPAKSEAATAIIIGNGLLLLGIVVALAAGIPYYRKRRGLSREMVRWGGLLSAPGAAAVLLGSVAEVTHAHKLLNYIEFTVLSAAALVVIAILVTPIFSSRFTSNKKGIENNPDDEDKPQDSLKVVVTVHLRREDKDGDEVGHHEKAANGGQLA
jgi:hypothetical protein